MVAARIIAGEIFGHWEIWREKEDVLQNIKLNFGHLQCTNKKTLGIPPSSRNVQPNGDMAAPQANDTPQLEANNTLQSNDTPQAG